MTNGSSPANSDIASHIAKICYIGQGWKNVGQRGTLRRDMAGTPQADMDNPRPI